MAEGLGMGEAFARQLSMKMGGFTAMMTDYNVVESVLLCCSVLVALSGIVFENVHEDSPYAKERKGLTYMAIGIVSFSLIYIIMVMCFEINR